MHSECRKRYCHPNQKRTEKEQLTETVIRSPKTRKSCDNKFDYKNSCLFCGTAAKVNHRKRGTDVYFIRTLPILLSIKDVCKSRNDEWGNEVLGRIEYAQDLPAVEARYHQTCSSNFRSGYKIPSKYAQVPNESKRGRPVNARSEETFAEVVRYFEDNQNEQITVSDLVEKMKELTCEDAYSTVYMKKKLIDHFGDSIIISELDGKANVVTFKSAAHSILNTFYNRQKKNDCESEKTAIIKTAAKLIQSDIKDIGANKEFYPSSDEIVSIESNLKCVPGSLQDFLKHIIENKKSEVKIASIAQAIIQSSISRKVLEPLQIGLGVFCHHQFGSKFLIDILNSMGFCSSYQEVQRFESSAAATYGTDFCKTPEQFLQFVGDNVDHNTNTLDGHGSFHGMGIIATLTPKIKQSRHIPRIQATNEDIAKIGKVNIAYYKQPSHAMEMLIFKKLVDPMIDVLEYEACDFILKVARPLRPLCPGWSGYMQAIQTGQFPGQSDMVFLPMIDLNPSDLNCIYSTLRFVAEQAKRVSTVPVVTFDQPLYWKAMTIVSNELQDSDLKSVIVRLGAFHTQMSFLGCIGKIMEDSGLKELLSTVYAPNTVGHMLNGKAIGRAIRGHMLVHDALNTLLLEKTFPFLHNDNCKQVGASDDDTEVEISDRDENNNSVAHVDNETEASNSSETGLMRLVNLYDKLMAKEVSPNEVISNPDIDKTKDELQKTKISLSNCRTAQLWLLYLELIDLLKRFIAAERTGNWKSHLKTLHDMLPFFGAAGHNLYLKSAYVYLQQMLMLPQNSPLVYETFLQGGHVMRRSDRYWAGLSSDLIIEQVLMRSVKVNGGLTRGRGLSETQRALWVLSMPACADISNSLQEFTGEKYVSSDQHVEASITRIERDTKDRHTIISFLRERNPFASDDSQLRNIETGAVAETKVNVDRAKIIGQSIVRGMVDKKVTDYTFKRTDQVVTLGSKNSVNVGSDQISIDPQILFQRLIAISDDTLDDTEEIFKYELSSQPSSLFDSSGLLREAQKPKLAAAIWEKGDCSGDDTMPNVKFVLDGGSILQRLPWTHGSTFGQICSDYVSLIEANYGTPCIVFDGYHGPSIKDATHDRRAKGNVGVRIKFDLNTPCRTTKDTFLSNKENKQNFINMLGNQLEKKGCRVKHADGDADLNIVKAAVASAEENPTVVIGEDTDLLILLCFYANVAHHEIIFRSDINRAGIKMKKTWNISKTKFVIGANICRLLPFIHAFTGCDTTSRIYGIGKGQLLKKVEDPNVKDFAKCFMDDTTRSEVEQAGEEVFIALFNGKEGEGLNYLRYKKFVHKATVSKSVVEVQSLPPTTSAARMHSFRTYLQVQTWLGNELNPTEWGWRMVENKYVPIKTTIAPAPERLLKVVKCSCKSNCDTRRCSCRKHGLACTEGCSECRGTDCSNIEIVGNGDGDSDLDEEFD